MVRCTPTCRHSCEPLCLPPLVLPLCSSGDLVTLCRNNPLTERAFEALVLDRGRWELRLVADGPPPGLNDGVWR